MKCASAYTWACVPGPCARTISIPNPAWPRGYCSPPRKLWFPIRFRDKTLDLVYINTKAQCADLFTKQLSPKVHWTLAKNIMNIPNTHTDLPQSANCTALHSNCHDLFYPDATSSDAPEGGYRAGSSYCFNNCRLKGTGPQ